jgi:hypothetical protein
MATHVDKTLEHIARSRKGKRVVRRIGWAVLAFVILLVLVVVAGAAYQGIASTVDASAYPPQADWSMWAAIACTYIARGAVVPQLF